MSFLFLSLSEWTIDSAHSRMGFTVRHMGISDANGSFDKVDFKISAPNDDFTDATLDLNVETASINTGLEARDNHLRSADFFEVDKYPTLTFKSSSCKKVKGNRYLIKGNLSMHGITKEIMINAIHNGNSKNRSGNDIAGFKITGKINKSDFGIGKDIPTTILADEIYLNADFEVVKN